MARAVVFTYSDPQHGPPHPAPPLGIFAELARRGEELTVWSSANHRAAIEAAGARFREYSCLPAAASEGRPGGILRRMANAHWVLPEVFEALRADRPDYLLLDAAASWGRVSAELLGLPVVSYRNSCAVHREMLDDAELARRFYAGELDRQYGSHTADAAALECRCGVNLVLLPRELQPEADRFDASYRFVGQCPGAELEPDAFPWRDLGLDPLIYISFDTVAHRRPEFFRACAEAFGGLTFDVVVSVGQGAPELPAERGAPANFLLVAYVPLSKLLERTTLAISGGEAAIVDECARNGVPQLLYAPYGEQFLLASRVQQLGAGLRLDDGDLEGGRLRQIAGRFMADPSYCRAAEALRQSISPSSGAAHACGEILAFVSRASAKASS